MTATDRNQAAPPQSTQDEVAQKLQRGAAALALKHGADLNQQAPFPEYDPVTKRRFFDAAPSPLKRLLGTPVAQTGKYAQGPNHERLVTSGWGDPRPATQNSNIHTARHQGLDFPGPVGEPIFASGDGTVTFVGFQASRGNTEFGGKQAIDVDGITADYAGKRYLDGRGNVVTTNNASVGFGGICCFVRHNADFEGYETEYFHLTSVTVHEGQRVTEGQQIGTMGWTGFSGLFFASGPSGTHLHYQVLFVISGASAIVRPTYLVPNYWPGHADSTVITQAAQGVAPIVNNLGIAVAGVQVITTSGLATTQALDRATQLENQDATAIKTNQASYADLVAGRLGAQQAALYQTIAAFQANGIVVQAPMTFDFTTGLWSADTTGGTGSPL